MSASESASGAANLHKSIEQLIAQTVRQTQATNEAEKQQLTVALNSALAEIEASQLSLNRAAELLRSALGTNASEIGKVSNDEAEVAELSPSPAPEPEVVPAAVVKPDVGPTAAPTDDRGPHEMDVIAHNANIAIASGLQSWLRGREEVANAQTREFVGGELRLHLEMTNGIEMPALEKWLGDNGGQIVTNTDKVIEVRFGAAA